MKKILFLIVALASMLTCLFYAFDNSLFQKKEIEKAEEPKHKLIYDADYDFSEPLVVEFMKGELEGKDTIVNSSFICNLWKDSLFISIGQGFMTGINIDFKMAQDSVLSRAYMYSCTYSHDYQNIYSRVVVEKKNWKVGDSLNIFMDLIFTCYEEDWDFRDTVNLKGSLKMKIRANNDISVKWREQHVYDFFQLVKNRPDTVTNISLRGLELDTIPNELKLFKNLKKLDLQGNSISVEELYKIRGLKKLKELRISGEYLETFPNVLIQLTELKSLMIDDIKFSTLPSKFKRLQKLEELWIRSNKLTKFPKAFSQMPNLKKLYMWTTEIKDCKSKIKELKQLEDYDFMYKD
ncbi:hypothetical protein V9L05_21360 [Bernardetia sp. Wsw4-3y2]|uniref:leucine-rich repeat domain-containing protein n=1 Tax=Bernardetia sp. Wsw4-3y2 TaxID=3127471 RepID=UPI0030D20A72